MPCFAAAVTVLPSVLYGGSKLAIYSCCASQKPGLQKKIILLQVIYTNNY
jgi:hypothetical protein